MGITQLGLVGEPLGFVLLLPAYSRQCPYAGFFVGYCFDEIVFFFFSQSVYVAYECLLCFEFLLSCFGRLVYLAADF